jgi:hypothetical protein
MDDSKHMSLKLAQILFNKLVKVCEEQQMNIWIEKVEESAQIVYRTRWDCATCPV